MILEAGRPCRKCSVALFLAVLNLGDRQRLETPSHRVCGPMEGVSVEKSSDENAEVQNYESY